MCVWPIRRTPSSNGIATHLVLILGAAIFTARPRKVALTALVVLLMFGACVFRLWLLGAAPQPALDRRLLRITRALAWAGLGSGVAWLVLITASMAGSWSAAWDLSTVQLVLDKTFIDARPLLRADLVGEAEGMAGLGISFRPFVA